MSPVTNASPMTHTVVSSPCTHALCSTLMATFLNIHSRRRKRKLVRTTMRILMQRHSSDSSRHISQRFVRPPALRSRRILGRSLTAQSKQSSNHGMARERSPIEFVKRSVTNSVLLSTFRPWCSVTVMTIQVPESASLVTLLPERTGPTATSW